MDLAACIACQAESARQLLQLESGALHCSACVNRYGRQRHDRGLCALWVYLFPHFDVARDCESLGASRDARYARDSAANVPEPDSLHRPRRGKEETSK